MTINLLTAAMIIYLFSDDGLALFLTVWGASFVLAAAVSFWSWKRSRRNRPKGTSARGIRRIILYATFFGCLWGAVAYVLFPNADTMHQLFLAALMAGLISGGAFALSTVPAAALVYTWIVVLGMGGALLLAAYSVFETVAFMLCVYAVFLSRNICAHGQLFIDRLHDELKLEAQRELIGLLLNDFEEHASDWLWETDASGVLVRVSDRFAKAAGKTPAELQGASFADVALRRMRIPPPELEDVLKRMAWRTPFRDVVVPVEIGEDLHYWLLSGQADFRQRRQVPGLSWRRRRRDGQALCGRAHFAPGLLRLAHRPAEPRGVARRSRQRAERRMRARGIGVATLSRSRPVQINQ